jgi:hypothetical protein
MEGATIAGAFVGDALAKDCEPMMAAAPIATAALAIPIFLGLNFFMLTPLTGKAFTLSHKYVDPGLGDDEVPMKVFTDFYPSDAA